MDKLTAAQILQFASLLIGLGIKAVEQKSKDEGKPVEVILTEADATWKQTLTEAEDLLKQGHQ
jgi:hypothetical protein